MNTDEILFTLKALRVSTATVVIAEERDASNLTTKANALMQFTPFDEDHPLIVLTTTEQGYTIYSQNLTLPNTYVWLAPSYVTMPLRAYILNVLSDVLTSVLILNYYNAICNKNNAYYLLNKGKYTVKNAVQCSTDVTMYLYKLLTPYLLPNVAMVTIARNGVNYCSTKLNPTLIDALPYGVVLYNLKALRSYLYKGLPKMTNGTFNLLFALYCAERGLTFTAINDCSYTDGDYEPTVDDYELLATIRGKYPYLFNRKAGVDLQYLYDLATETRALLREE